MAANSRDPEQVLSSTNDQRGARKRRGSLSWDRVVVYDTETGNVDIRKKQEVDKNKSGYEELKLPKGKKQISLFVDSDKENRVKTGDETRQDKDIFLARLNLDNLGFTNRTLFRFGKLSTLYVAAPWSVSGSPCSSAASGASVA
ncbi:hypothetical protein K458DRAFT_427903 [Lentithecium fluviatile CBS 122367]|uniref:Uncharacterized protein n=1 Tax=Lentithecium fluviatile CBS 122367 TaxID=1168545 RepID=A0A6G1JCI1_9PLEO|nr:hypothetical protein K458DRAFT_427903 [Lentithecium fluviatile CBS 122367]